MSPACNVVQHCTAVCVRSRKRSKVSLKCNNSISDVGKLMHNVTHPEIMHAHKYDMGTDSVTILYPS